MALASSLAASLPIAAAAAATARFRFGVRFRGMASASAAAAAPGAPARVGVVQMTSVGDVDANYATCARLTKASPLSPPVDLESRLDGSPVFAGLALVAPPPCRPLGSPASREN
jgi:hypothetical protein